jgi:RNase P/RNase MRP subunit p30
MTQILISGINFDETRKKIRANSGKEIVFTTQDDELARKVLEKEQISVLLINQRGRQDKLKQRTSGFNQVLAKIAKKKNITIGINLEEITTQISEEKSEIIARIRQNVELCKKNKLNMTFFPKDARDQYDLKALGLILGMPTWMTKNL